MPEGTEHSEFNPAFQADGGGQETKIAPSFQDMDEFDKDINELGYARYDYPALRARETEFKNLIEGAADIALYNSGMAAISSAIETERLRAGDIVFCAKDIYGTTKSEVNHFAEGKGISVIEFDSTDMDKLQEMIDQYHPRLVIAETIANSKEMPVTDLSRLGPIADKANAFYQDNLTPEDCLDHLLKAKDYGEAVTPEIRQQLLAAIEEFKESRNPKEPKLVYGDPMLYQSIFQKFTRPLAKETGLDVHEVTREIERIIKFVLRRQREKLSLIIDNTLPSPQLVNPLQAMKDTDLEKVIVESGTKHYQEGANAITLGIAYSDSEEKMKALKSRRIELGTYLQPNDEAKLPHTLPETMPEKMKNHARNTLKLAQVVSQIPEFKVYHPNLPDHPQYELASNLAPEGAVTLFYLDVPEGTTNREFMEEMKKRSNESFEVYDESTDFSPNPTEDQREEEAKKRELIELGSSFGHPNTWLSNYSLGERTVRIAVGSQSEEEFEKTLDLFRQYAQ